MNNLTIAWLVFKRVCRDCIRDPLWLFLQLLSFVSLALTLWCWYSLSVLTAIFFTLLVVIIILWAVQKSQHLWHTMQNEGKNSWNTMVKMIKSLFSNQAQSTQNNQFRNKLTQWVKERHYQLSLQEWKCCFQCLTLEKKASSVSNINNILNDYLKKMSEDDNGLTDMEASLRFNSNQDDQNSTYKAFQKDNSNWLDNKNLNSFERDVQKILDPSQYKETVQVIQIS